jgi:predicted metal-binding membrane protein
MVSLNAATSRRRHLTPPGAVLLLVASGAWLAVVSLARGMGAAPGTMGLSIGAFIAIWTLMMAAMMLPSVAGVASLYARSIRSRRALRLGGFASGYLLAWSAAGVPVFALAWVAGRLTDHHPGIATGMAAGIFAACGLYQLTPIKDRCLVHCRSPLAQLLHFGTFRGRLREIRVGLFHGAYCLSCCWALMVLLIAFGVMNITAMVILAAIILVEKCFTRGVAFSRMTGVVALGLAVAVVWLPGLAPGLDGSGAVMSPMVGM